MHTNLQRNFYVEEASTRAGKKIISKLEDLRFCEYLPRKNIGDAGTVGEGLGFVIDRKVNVNGSLQDKVHNSKGKTDYVTANEAFVYVK
ncbi:hypothetical protein CN317_00825 [Bacillus cereus]|nr:hypothetical protein CN317_00825 [Bacillus cereus]